MPNARREGDYPNVACDLHPGEVSAGYWICLHILDAGAKIARIDASGEMRMGRIVCAIEHNAGDLQLCCASCARPFLERGIQWPPGAHTLGGAIPRSIRRSGPLGGRLLYQLDGFSAEIDDRTAEVRFEIRISDARMMWVLPRAEWVALAMALASEHMGEPHA